MADKYTKLHTKVELDALMELELLFYGNALSLEVETPEGTMYRLLDPLKVRVHSFGGNRIFTHDGRAYTKDQLGVMREEFRKMRESPDHSRVLPMGTLPMGLGGAIKKSHQEGDVTVIDEMNFHECSVLSGENDGE